MPATNIASIRSLNSKIVDRYYVAMKQHCPQIDADKRRLVKDAIALAACSKVEIETLNYGTLKFEYWYALTGVLLEEGISRHLDMVWLSDTRNDKIAANSER